MKQCSSCGGFCKGGCERENIQRKARLPPPSEECIKAFEQWYGFSVNPDMDIQTSVALDNAHAAIAALRERMKE